MENKIKCPNCKGNETIKWCKRKTENRGEIQRYKCKSCNFYFTIDDGFFRMRNTPQKITQSVDLFYRGVSTRKVQEHLAIFHPHNASNVSIYKWVVRYAKMISKLTNKLKVNVGAETQIDEIEFHRRKSHKAKLGAEKNFFIDSICPETKFLISSEYAKTRNRRDIKAVISRIKERTDNQIQMATTDGWMAYIKTIKSVFGYNNKLGRYNVFHNRVIVSEKDEVFNYPIERLHNSIRARTKTMRGFHGSINSANAIMKGYEIYYNFITKHQQIKCCPYELAIPELKEFFGDEKNRWLSLIKLATQNI
ncbi:IS1/IS6 family transposase [Candidatus Pacearchaeota archaeon]|nr:IS1/IS6 family transposase [Candidatus Pacearchaeota archaeon]